MPRHNLAVVDPVPSGSARINALAAKYKAIAEEERDLKDRKKAINEKLLAAMKDEAVADDEGKLRLATDDYKLVVVGGRSADTISAKKLLALGVRPTVIKKATVKGTDYEYVRVDPRTAAEAEQA